MNAVGDYSGVFSQKAMSGIHTYDKKGSTNGQSFTG